jgi:hypothetical protein
MSLEVENMVTISLQLPDELANRLKPLQDRLPEIIELGLRQLEIKGKDEPNGNELKHQVLAALYSTGIVTLPQTIQPPARIRYTPVRAGGPSASEMIIRERRGE